MIGVCVPLHTQVRATANLSIRTERCSLGCVGTESLSLPSADSVLQLRGQAFCTCYSSPVSCRNHLCSLRPAQALGPLAHMLFSPLCRPHTTAASYCAGHDLLADSSSLTHQHHYCLHCYAGEKAVRRDPRLHKYTGTSCPDYRKGSCKRGSGCPYAHGVFEVWLHPSRYRTQMCKDAALCTRQVRSSDIRMSLCIYTPIVVFVTVVTCSN